MNCYIHAEEKAVGACVGCGEFICQACATKIKAKNYCKSCVDELFEEKNKQLEKEQDKNEKSNQGSNQEQMVVVNVGGASSGSPSSGASSGDGGRPINDARPYPRNSVLIHVILLFTTAGIGNIFYFLYIKDKQKRWERHELKKEKMKMNHEVQMKGHDTTTDKAIKAIPDTLESVGNSIGNIVSSIITPGKKK